MKPTPIRLEEWHRAKAKSMMKKKGVKRLAEYIRHLIENDK